MEKAPLYSIGHGTRKTEELIALLQKYGINYLIDVRSRPYSKYNPQFNQNELNLSLAKNDIKYVFMGDDLGGRPGDALCYTLDGKIDYNIVKTRNFFKRGIERLKTAYAKNIALAIMCSETKPENCHRSKLIGAALLNESILLQHIDELGELKDQVAVDLLR
ncbi:MAG: DUF488 domain-containing protein [Bacteroidetes bacterium]|nr:DUF488 domain-containing protein [Bacteroidota bacterium]